MKWDSDHDINHPMLLLKLAGHTVSQPRCDVSPSLVFERLDILLDFAGVQCRCGDPRQGRFGRDAFRKQRKLLKLLLAAVTPVPIDPSTAQTAGREDKIKHPVPNRRSRPGKVPSLLNEAVYLQLCESARFFHEFRTILVRQIP